MFDSTEEGRTWAQTGPKAFFPISQMVEEQELGGTLFRYKFARKGDATNISVEVESYQEPEGNEEGGFLLLVVVGEDGQEISQPKELKVGKIEFDPVSLEAGDKVLVKTKGNGIVKDVWISLVFRR